MAGRMIDYVHPRLHEEVAAIGGRYVLTEERRVPFRGRDLWYLTGYAVTDTSCCGVWGCGYAVVPGFVLHWQYTTNSDGLPVSRAEAIQDIDVQQEIRRLITRHEPITQIVFQ